MFQNFKNCDCGLRLYLDTFKQGEFMLIDIMQSSKTPRFNLYLILFVAGLNRGIQRKSQVWGKRNDFNCLKHTSKFSFYPMP
jgi:hypothetical protein